MGSQNNSTYTNAHTNSEATNFPINKPHTGGRLGGTGPQWLLHFCRQSYHRLCTIHISFQRWKQACNDCVPKALP